ncbi:MAG: DUF1156 domain-containing protein, partial [Lentisphaerae bacterium]|nr:DUF1156 domain-containing protein [Lentisphaerota bacterium]
MSQRKKLIEVALPLEAINAASAREKSIRHGHPSTLHLWWARRPLAAARAVIFTSLVDDPDDPNAPPEFVEACRKLRKGANASVEDTPRQRLFDFIELLVQWESTTDEDVLETARELIRLSTNGNPPPLLDPFAGGGSIPLEAQRLGLEAHASDLNPVAVMINKALIEIPPRFANMPPVNPRDREKIGGQAGWKGAQGLAADVRYYGEWMRDRAWERIGHLYPKGPNGETVIAWLWARTVKCPNPACGAQMPLVRSFTLGKKKGKEAWAKPQVDAATREIRFSVKQGKPPKEKDGTMKRSGAECVVCGEPVPFEYIRQEGQAGRMNEQMMAIATEGRDGRNYYAPDELHCQISREAEPHWKPEQQVTSPSHDVDRLPMYGMFSWGDAFTDRQLVALTNLSELVTQVRSQIEADAIEAGLLQDSNSLRNQGSEALAYSEAVSVYLAFAVDRSADRGSTVCSWDNSPKMEALRNTFARQAIPMTWDFAEGNPFSSSSGNWLNNVDWVAKAVELLHPDSIGFAVQRDAQSNSFPENMVISTDPPYYDNIGYADLSDFFYVWMRQALQSIFPDIFATLLVPKDPEIVASPHRFDGRKDDANRHFENGLHQAFLNIHRVVLPDFPLTTYYAFK